MNKEAQAALNKTIFSIMTEDEHAFLSVVMCMVSKRIATPEDKCPTACISATEMVINGEYFLAQSKSVRQSIVIHELWHLVLDHVGRYDAQGFKCFEKYNRAGDYVINQLIVDVDLPLGEGWLFDPKYKGKSTEQIYALLPDNPKTPNPQNGDFTPNEEQSEVTPEEAKEIVDNMISNAYIQQQHTEKGIGNLPEELVRYLEEKLKPKVDWCNLLKKTIRAKAKEYYSYVRINKRYQPNFILPTLTGHKVDLFAAAVDASGSVSSKEFDQFLSEIQQARNVLKPKYTHVIDFTTRINTVHTLKGKSGDARALEFKGRGGTSLEPIFEYYDKSPLKPKVLVVLSDLYCQPIPLEDKPSYDVIWVCLGNPNARVNFGKLIHIEIHN